MLTGDQQFKDMLVSQVAVSSLKVVGDTALLTDHLTAYRRHVDTLALLYLEPYLCLAFSVCALFPRAYTGHGQTPLELLHITLTALDRLMWVYVTQLCASHSSRVFQALE